MSDMSPVNPHEGRRTWLLRWPHNLCAGFLQLGDFIVGELLIEPDNRRFPVAAVAGSLDGERSERIEAAPE